MNRSASPRILMVTPRYFPLMGGVETHVAEVSRRLVAAGVDLTILTADATRQLPPTEVHDGVKLRRVPAWPKGRDYYFAPALLGIIRNEPWDLIHCQSYHTLVAPLAMLAARLAGRPYVVTFHGGGHSSQLRNSLRGAQMSLLRPLLAGAARLVAIADFEVELYGRRLGVPRERFAMIPNGADLPAYDLSKAQPASGTTLVSVGRLERYKGHHRVIEALPHILNTRPETRLRIVGNGPYAESLHRLAATLGVSNRVEIGGIPPTNRQGMADVLAQASLVTLFSDFETHPIAALEALSLGKPVLVAHTSGLGELADRGLVRSVPHESSAVELAHRILSELDAPFQPPPFTLPTWDDCAGGLLSLYNDVLQRSV